MVAKLTSQKAPGIHLPVAPSPVTEEAYWHIRLFMGFLGIQTLVLMLTQQAHNPVSYAAGSLGIFDCLHRAHPGLVSLCNNHFL